MSELLRQAIVAEIAKGLLLLQAPAENIAKAEASSDAHVVSQLFESCGAPIAYLLALGSYHPDAPDEATLEKLTHINRLVSEIVAGGKTRDEIFAKMRADGRLSFPVRPSNAYPS